MDKHYLLAWINYHDGEAQDYTQWAQWYTQFAQKYTQCAHEHEAFADYYINLLTGRK